jgi:Uma2 family endonuclease
MPVSSYPEIMQLVLPDIETRATFKIQAERPMDDDEYFEFCSQNAELRIERDANGEIVIMPPAGFETGYRNNELSRQLGNWARADGRGVALDSNTEYVLPSGAALSPDASWVLKSRLASFSKEQKRRFLPLCPDFVVELISPTDRLGRVRAKMREWLDNGAQLGWLIDADRRTVHVYRPGRQPEKLVDIHEIAGVGPVKGFRLELGEIWQGV